MNINIEMIEKYLKDNNLSKKEFCTLCKISLSTLNKVLSNKVNLKLLSIVKIARVLNVRIHDLFIKKQT